MKQNKIAMKTMAIKARVANFLRTELYNYSDNEWAIKYNNKLKDIKSINKEEFFNKLYPLVQEMHSELNNYKKKRRYKNFIYQNRINSPQTKSSIKKLTPKKHRIGVKKVI